MGKATYVLLVLLPCLHGRLHLHDRRDLLLCHQIRPCHPKHLPQNVGGYALVSRIRSRFTFLHTKCHDLFRRRGANFLESLAATEVS
jgi:hypothetical protein